jgi:protein-S-isoprenylcysteine O-methyltransferase Ste14
MLRIIYSIGSYLAFLGSFVYFAWFSDGLGVAKTVDTGGSGGASALLLDLFLILLFGLQHSVMARPAFKRRLSHVLPSSVERATYVLASSLVLALLIWQWRPVPGLLWSVDNSTLAAGLWGINALGWLGVPLSSLLIDHFELVGLKQAFAGFRRSSLKQRGFVTPLLYKYIRHPMMSSLLIGLWVTPHMTLSHALLSAGMSVYVLVGVHFEERALVREFGRAYVAYQASTPRFFPLGLAKKDALEGPASSPASGGAR